MVGRGQALRVLAAVGVMTIAGACAKSAKHDDAAAPTTSAAPAATTTTVAATTLPTLPTLPDACSLVTKPEAEQLAQTPLDDPNQVKETCTYTGPVTGPLAQVEVFIGDGAKKFLDIDRDTLGHAFTSPPGIGDEAAEEDDAIFIRNGTTWVSLRLTLLNDPAENKDRLEALAKTVAGRF